MNLHVMRLHTSSYHAPDFSSREKRALEAIDPRITYGSLDTAPHSSTCYVLLTNTHVNVDSIPSEILSKTQLILHGNSGYDNFSPRFVQDTPIPIVIGHAIRRDAVCEYVQSALLHHLTPVMPETHWNQSRQWNRSLLRQCHIGIVGHGHIGGRLHTQLEACGAHVSIYDPHRGYPHFSPGDFDVLILAAGLNPTSHHLINSNVLRSLKSNILIINAARGPLIDEPALFDFLRRTPSAFAVLDVSEHEPWQTPTQPLPNNVLRTSHIAGVFNELDENLIQFEIDTLRDYLALDAVAFEQRHHHSLLRHRLQDGYLL